MIAPPRRETAGPARHAYAATLSIAQRKLSVRLEGFGDIVFGVAVSRCRSARCDCPRLTATYISATRPQCACPHPRPCAFALPSCLGRAP